MTRMLALLVAFAAAPALAEDPVLSPEPLETPQVAQQADEPLDPFFAADGQLQIRASDDPVAGELNPVRDWDLTEGLDDEIDTHPSDTIRLPRPAPAFVIDLD